MELPHIGQNCVVCNRNDYLPFKCSHCDKIVCVDHKSNHGNECPLNNHESFQSTSGGSPGGPSESLKQACDFCRKITLKLELTECNYCKSNHCLYHRHQVQHNCTQLVLDQESREREQLERTRRQQEALDKLKDINKQQATKLSQQPNEVETKKPPPSTFVDLKKLALAKRIRIMKIKQSARGPPNILDSDRIYFEVKFLHEPKSTLSNASKDGKTIRIYSTAKHPVGRMIDWSASEMDLTNKNHVERADQLIFKIKKNNINIVQSNKNSSELDSQSEFIILDSHVTFEHYLTLNELDNGDELLLTYCVTTS